jgi:hypothetical protein
MEKEVANHITRCLKFEKVKTEHRHQTGFLQLFLILEWKWEVFKLYFITKLPKTMKKHDSIMAVVDELTKENNFIMENTTYKASNIAQIYMKEVVRLHGVPKAIVSARDSKFSSNF